MIKLNRLLGQLGGWSGAPTAAELSLTDELGRRLAAVREGVKALEGSKLGEFEAMLRERGLGIVAVTAPDSSA